MRIFLLSLCLLLGGLAQAQKSVKYKGLTVPVGVYWEIVQNDGNRLHLKMKGEEVSFYVKYLGKDTKSDDLAGESLMFLLGIGLTDVDAFLASKQEQVVIGKRGVAIRTNWKDRDGKREWHSYMTKFDAKNKSNHYFIFAYKDECSRGTGTYWLHREGFEKKTKFSGL
jgi:hypothetical protein